MKPPIVTTANIAKRHPIMAPAITPDRKEQVLLITDLPFWN